MIVAGFGMRGTATQASLHAALQAALDGQNLPVSCLATLSDKATRTAFQDLVRHLALPHQAIAQAQIAQIETVTQSAQARALRDTGSVAEATALAAAGPGAVLLRARVISPDRLATCALAQSHPTGGSQ